MFRTVVRIAGLAFGVFCCAYGPYWVKHAKDRKDRNDGIRAIIFGAFVLGLGLFMTIYDNSLLWFGQHADNAVIELHIDESAVEDTSALYLFERFGSDTSIDDIVAVMGDKFTEFAETPYYSMRYRNCGYTVMGHELEHVRFSFDRRGKRILSISCGIQPPDRQLYEELLEYLTQNTLGEPDSVGDGAADWRGVHLECNDYWLLLVREY